MTIYLLYMAFFALLSVVKVSSISDKKLLKVNIFSLYILATIRSLTVGNDTQNYFNLFESISRAGYTSSDRYRFEIGYLILNRIIGLTTDNYIIFLAIVNIIIYYAYYIFIKENSNNYSLSLFLFLALGTWGRTANIIRLELAVAMFIYAYMFQKRGRIFCAILLGLLGVSFQRISIVFFAIFFVPQRISRRFYVFTGFASVILLASLKQILSIAGQLVPYYGDFYIESTNYVFGEIKLSIVIQLVMHLVIVAFCMRLYKYKRAGMNKKKMQKIESQLNMTYISSLVMLVSLGFNLLDRCNAIFDIFIMLLLPNISKISRNRIPVTMIVVTMGITYFAIINVFRPEWNSIIPYHTFLFDR